MFAISLKELRELFRDHRTLGLLFGLPVVLLVIFGYAANFSVDQVDVAVLGTGADEVADEISSASSGGTTIRVIETDPGGTEDDVEDVLRQGDADAVVVVRSTDEQLSLIDRVDFYVDGSEIFPAQAAQAAFLGLVVQDVTSLAQERQAELTAFQDESSSFREDVEEAISGLRQLEAALAQVQTDPSPAALAALGQLEVPDLGALEGMPEAPAGDPADLQLPDDVTEISTVVFNPDLKTSWVMIPGLIGLILTFVATVITSIGLVREREAGTLEQLAVMPVRPMQVIAGKIAPYFLIAALDMIVITILGLLLFSVPFNGAVWFVALASVVFLFVVLGLGVLISTVSSSTGQAVQLAILVVLPQVLLSGLIFPLESMATPIRWIGYCLPLTWFIEIARGVMLRGAGLQDELFALGLLGAMAVVVFGLALVRMRQLLRQGGTR
ncbi:ABC transporter permease [Cellulomonas xiejunii]|uniref:ABC transporter permease n=1 Tax=Cellulomonas xiejunii TaxID=2968083 RepID=UPI001D0DC1D5|nr:ABC transporter permease [Cellulomonas xiejunii]MCC2314665.1 ABC transporter permease [Cellulomonas xiejunii]